MVAWIHNSRRRFIAGVFASRATADQHLAAIPEPYNANCSVGERPGLAFPCFIAQDHTGFRFLSEGEVATELVQAAADRKDDEWCYVNLYRLTGEFVPGKPGRDDMGRLPHWHIENRDLDLVASDGLSALWNE